MEADFTANDFRFVDEEFKANMLMYESECNRGKGDRGACHNIGEYVHIVLKEYQRADLLFTANCKRNHAESCFSLATSFATGIGVAKDEDKAEELYGKACTLGNNNGCYSKALLQYGAANRHVGKVTGKPLKSVEEITKNKQAAVDLLRKNCHDGSEERSCYFLGILGLDKANPNRHPASSLKLFKKACDQMGHGPSCHTLAVMYNAGDVGVDKNPALFEKYKARTVELMEQRAAQMGGSLSDDSPLANKGR